MKKVIFKIDGMMCGMCEAHVNDNVREACGDKLIKVKSSHKKNLCEALLEDDMDTIIIKDAISKDGYRVLSEETIENYTKKGMFW